jgi:GxxExxY protein
MNTDLNLITEKIIGCSHKVGNALGCGFLEKVYANALVHELRKAGFAVEQQKPIDVYYDGIVVGEYFADIVVNGQVIIELKAQRHVEEIHSAQCINYLTATGIPLCLLINFWGKVEVKRFAGRAHQPS